MIAGRAAIVRHSILNNRRQVLTEDTSGRLALWDVLHGKRVRDFGANANWDETLKSLFEIVAVPNWFTVDTKTGVRPTEPKCFANECLIDRVAWRTVNHRSLGTSSMLQRLDTSRGHGTQASDSIPTMYERSLTVCLDQCSLARS